MLFFKKYPQKALKLLRFGAWCFGLVPMHEVIKTALIKNSVMAVRRANTQSKQGILMATSRAIYPLVFCGLMIPRQAKRMLYVCKSKKSRVTTFFFFKVFTFSFHLIYLRWNSFNRNSD